MTRTAMRNLGFDQLTRLSWQVALSLAGIAAVIALTGPSLASGHTVLKLVILVLQPVFWFLVIILAAASLVVARRQGKLPAGISRMMEQQDIGPDGEGQPSIQPTDVSPSGWSVDLLRVLEWKRFEILLAAFYARRGFRIEVLRRDADGGVDAALFFKKLPAPVAMIQCRSGAGRYVGVKPVRELLGLMAHNKVTKGIFHATGDFTREAREFARVNNINPISGSDLVRRIAEMPGAAQQELLKTATEGDYTTPSCPSCGTKMAKPLSGEDDYWECSYYPRCRHRFPLSSPSTTSSRS
jgi:restriction system protein